MGVLSGQTYQLARCDSCRQHRGRCLAAVSEEGEGSDMGLAGPAVGLKHEMEMESKCFARKKKRPGTKSLRGYTAMAGCGHGGLLPRPLIRCAPDSRSSYRGEL